MKNFYREAHAILEEAIVMTPTEAHQGIRRHKLLTAEARKALPPLYTNEGTPTDEQVVHVKFFSPYSGWTWYATEFDGDDLFFGFVDGHEGEWGYFSYRELQEANRNGLPLVERDCYWPARPFGEIGR